MDREKEIQIILNYIKEDLKTYYNSSESLILDKIVEYGILVKEYQDELKSLK